MRTIYWLADLGRVALESSLNGFRYGKVPVGAGEMCQVAAAALVTGLAVWFAGRRRAV